MAADLVPDPFPSFALPPEAWDRICILDGLADTARRNRQWDRAAHWQAEAERVRQKMLTETTPCPS